MPKPKTKSQRKTKPAAPRKSSRKTTSKSSLKKQIAGVKKEELKIDHEVLKAEKKIDKVLDSLTKSGIKEYWTYLSSPKRVFMTNLLAGIARGFGIVLGATVVVSVVVFVIGKILSGIPIVGEFFQWLNTFLEESIQTSSFPRR